MVLTTKNTVMHKAVLGQHRVRRGISVHTTSSDIINNKSDKMDSVIPPKLLKSLGGDEEKKKETD